MQPVWKCMDWFVIVWFEWVKRLLPNVCWTMAILLELSDGTKVRTQQISLILKISVVFFRQRITSFRRSHSTPWQIRFESCPICGLAHRSSAFVGLSRASGKLHPACRIFLTECHLWVISERSIRYESFSILVLPETITIVGNELLSNLSLGEGSPGEFECLTSVSNPQAQLKVTRRSPDGQEQADIQYKTTSSYRDGINSIKFLVCCDTNECPSNHALNLFQLPPIDVSLHGSQLICEAVVDNGFPPSTKQVTYEIFVRRNYSLDCRFSWLFRISIQINPISIIRVRCSTWEKINHWTLLSKRLDIRRRFITVVSIHWDNHYLTNNTIQDNWC